MATTFFLYVCFCSKAIISFGFPVATSFACMHDCCFAFQRRPVHLIIFSFGPACACFNGGHGLYDFNDSMNLAMIGFWASMCICPLYLWPCLISWCFRTWEFDTSAWLPFCIIPVQLQSWVLVDSRFVFNNNILAISSIFIWFLSLCGFDYVWSFVLSVPWPVVIVDNP